MTVKKMELAWISVSDIKKAQEFFVQTLGLTVSGGSEEYKWLELCGPDGGAMLGVGQSSDGNDCGVMPGQNAIVTMNVDDIIASKALLESKNVKFLGDIVEVPGHVKMAMFVDHDGNKFQIVQCLDKK